MNAATGRVRIDGCGRWTELRPIAPGDEELLGSIVSDPANVVGYRYRGRTPSPAQLRHDLWAGVLCQYGIWGRRRGELVGLVSAFNASELDRHAHLGLCLRSDAHGQGWPFEAVGLFIEHLWDAFGLRKLYVQVDETTATRLRSLIEDLFVEEARLAGYHHRGDRRTDSVIYALWADRWFTEPNRHRRYLLRALADETTEDQMIGA